MHLTYSYKIKDVTPLHTQDVTEIEITVDYTPEEGVKEIIDVYAFNKVSGGCTDIGRFLIEIMGLDERIGIIADWYAIYHQALQEEKEYAELNA